MTGGVPTDRELECLRAYCEHGRIEVAAEHLGVTPQTLRNRLAKLYRKLGVSKAHSAVWVLNGRRLGDRDTAPRGHPARSLPAPTLRAKLGHGRAPRGEREAQA